MKIDIKSVPQLETCVAIHKSATQQEVAGPMCLAAAISAAILLYANS